MGASVQGQWHPDPTHRHQLRYWDGQQWTDHVSDGGAQSVDPVNAPTAPSSQTPAWGGAPPGYAQPPSPAYGGYAGYGGYGGPVRRMEHPQGTTILVLGILGLVICGLLSPIAWGMGNAARREMQAQPDVMWTNRGNVDAGRICGIIGTILWLVGIGILVLVLVAAAGSSS